MTTWRELAIGAAIAALLVLAANRIGENQGILCEHLYVPTWLVQDEPETVNHMLEICGLDNVRIMTLEVLKIEMSKHNATIEKARPSSSSVRCGQSGCIG